MSRGNNAHVVVPRPDRVRTLAGTPFGWIAAGLSREGWLRVLTPEAFAVYSFLCLAADRQGRSWYRRSRISDELGLTDQQVFQALVRLEQLDLVAYQPFRPGAPDGYRQVLSLPAGRAPVTVPAAVLHLAERLSLPADPRPILEDPREVSSEY
jgi:hypothetical protein